MEGRMHNPGARRRAARVGIVLTVAALVATPAVALAQSQGQQAGGRRQGGAEAIPSIDERTKDLKKLDGYFPL
jgi:hypothetical protein